MKVKHDAPDLLVIEDAPWLVGAALIVFILSFCAIGLFLLGAGDWAGLVLFLGGGGLGFGAFAVFVQKSQAIFDRRTGEVILRRRSLFGETRESHPLAEFGGAEIASRMSRSKQGTTIKMRRVELIFGEHRLPISEVWSNGSHHLRISRAINDWLDKGRGAA
ncbi:MAG: hypothetical protein ACLFRZ_03955 [Rhodosalinus sp.]|uniref:hypothetical protein n=1 Tax=Rhodosalinus sp. TaxID=2047741 RepID=UPI00397C9EE0